MFIDINKIDSAGLTFDRELELPDLEGPDGASIPVLRARLSGRAVPGERGVEMTGRLAGRVGLACARCLEPFEADIAADFLLNLVREPIEPGVGEVALDEQDTFLFHVPEGKVDYRTVAEEQIYLNLPLKPICRGDCAGLCPTCGTNRNLLECDCRPESVDPRLAALQTLKIGPRD